MAADLSVEPFKRLASLAPQGTDEPTLQAAADRYANTQDLYAAAADLWEEAALVIDITDTYDAAQDPQITSVSQDGISVGYAAKTSRQDNRFKTRGAYMQVANQLRKKSIPSTPLVIGDAVDRFEKDPYGLDPENGVIEIANWVD